MVDLFEEVEDQLRTEKYKQLALKILPWALGALVLVAVVIAVIFGVTKYRETRYAKAAEDYSAAIESLQSGDGEAAFTKFGVVAKDGPRGYKALALMVQGGIRLEDGKTQEAVALFDEAAKAAPSDKGGLIVADMARLKSAFALMDDAPYADLEARLTPLTEENRPYRAVAREALGLAKLNAGKVKEARADFFALSTALYAPQSLISRAEAAVALIDSGGAAAIPGVVKAAKAAAPTIPLAPEAPVATTQGAAQ